MRSLFNGRVIKKGVKRADGRVVLRLREHAAEHAPEPGWQLETKPKANEQSVILVTARLEADEIKTAAFQEGYREGYKEGRREAERAGREIRARAQTVLKQAEVVREQTLEELEPEVLELAVDIARRLVAGQLLLQADTIRGIVREALEQVRNRERFLVYAHPQDARILEMHADEFRGLVSPEATLRIMADESVKAGGCRIETEVGMVDATLESRWHALLEALHNGS